MPNRAWVTLATNDSYGLGALVLAHSLRRANSVYPAVVLITPSVTEAMRNRLSAVYAEVIPVDVLDSRDAAHLALLQRPELGITFTKIHCWTLTQYEKCVFLDADTLVVQNCDELFERQELSAAPDVGWPDCFNSGVFVFVPSNETYSRLITFAQERGSFDGGDQGLLNAFFSDWARGDISKHLPFLYNVTSAAFYSYIPALKHYGQDLKIIHFIGTAKPWLQNFNWDSRTVESPEHLRQFLQLWWDLFVGQVHSHLESAMDSAVGEEEVPFEPPPENIPEDIQRDYHYQPSVDPKSQFLWHHPEAKAEEPHILAQQVDMTKIHDPWRNYKGNIPAFSQPSSYPGNDFEEKISLCSWDYEAQQPTQHHAQQEHQHEQHHKHDDHDQSQAQYHHHHEQHNTHEYHHYHSREQDQPHHSHEQDQHYHSHEQDQHYHNSHEQDQPYHNHEQHDIPEQKWQGESNWGIHRRTSQDNLHQSHSSHFHTGHHTHTYSQQSVPQIHQHHDHVEHHSVPGFSSQKHSEDRHINGYSKHFNPFTTQPRVHVYHLHLDHRRPRRRHRKVTRLHTNANGNMKGHSSESESEDEFIIPRHPYDFFYLRHQPTIDPRGRKICKHEIPPTPPHSPLPEEYPSSPSDSPLPEEFDTASECEDQYTGVAGNLARVVPGSSSFQREAIDELTRRQGWEAGNIDYMGADSFDNIWAKISQTLNQQAPKGPSPPRKEPAPKQTSPVKEQPKPEAALALVSDSTPTAVPATTPEASAAASPAAVPVQAPPPAPETPAVAPTEPAQAVPTSNVASEPAETPKVSDIETKDSAPVPDSTKQASEKTEPTVPSTPPVTPKSTPEALTPVSEAPAPVLTAQSPASEPPALAAAAVAPSTAEAPKAAVTETVSASPAPAAAEAPKAEVTEAAIASPAPAAVAPVSAEVPKAVVTEAAPASPASAAVAPVSAEAPKSVATEATPTSPASVTVAPTEATPAPPAPAAVAPVASEALKAAATKTAPASPAPVAGAPTELQLSQPETTPEKSQDGSFLSATDSPPLANTPSKEETPAVPDPKSEERRKLEKLQLSPPAATDPLPTPDSELEDAATLAHAIIASELSASVSSPSPVTAPTSPLAQLDTQRLSVDAPEVPTPPVSLAQIGVKPKGKPTTAAQIASSVSSKPEPAKLAEATKPAETEKPVEATKSDTASTQPVQAPEQSAPATPTSPTTPTEAGAPLKTKKKTVKPVSPPKPDAPTKGAEATQPSEPSKQADPATPTTLTSPTTPSESGTADKPKKKPVTIKKKEAGVSGDAPAPVPPPRKKEKKPKEK